MSRKSMVLYVPQASSHTLLALIHSVANRAAHMVLVVDEVQSDHLGAIREAVDRSSGRIQLITIGHCRSAEPPDRVTEIKIDPLERGQIREIVRVWYPSMPLDHIEFVANFADGYVRLARLTAAAVIRNPSLDVHELLNNNQITQFLNRLLGGVDTKSLLVVAVLTNVGWEDDCEVEGETITNHLGLEWQTVRYEVDRFHNNLQIVPAGGRYRYISPLPLAILLAVQAWNLYKAKLATLPRALPSDRAREKYYARLKMMASHPGARKIALLELSNISSQFDFSDLDTVRRWAALSAVDPRLACKNLFDCLSKVDPIVRQKAFSATQRALISVLASMLTRSDCFYHAAKSLAFLAEADELEDDEGPSNGPANQFSHLFSIYLSGTPLPYNQRLYVLDELCETGRKRLIRPVIKSLGKTLSQRSYKPVPQPISDQVPEIEWEPKTTEERDKCLVVAVEHLNAMAEQYLPELLPDFLSTVKKLGIYFRDPLLCDRVGKLFQSIFAKCPEAREHLRCVIADTLETERAVWKELPSDQVDNIVRWHTMFEDRSLSGRLRQHLVESAWNRSEPQDLSVLAKEIIASPQVLFDNWKWLTSGEAVDSWRFGLALGLADEHKLFADLLVVEPDSGYDLRLLSGYIYQCRKDYGDQWYEEWLRVQVPRAACPASTLISIIRSCGATVQVAQQLLTYLSDPKADLGAAGQLAYGGWHGQLPNEILEQILRALLIRNFYEPGLVIVEERIKSAPESTDFWSALALEIVCTPEIIRSQHRNTYQWKELASTIVPRYPTEIAAAILQEHGRKCDDYWLMKFSPAADIFQGCTEIAPLSVWNVMKSHLENDQQAHSFCVGFSRKVAGFFPINEVMKWVKESPIERAQIVAYFAPKNLELDDTLWSQTLGLFGDKTEIANVFYLEYVSGSWMGAASRHWNDLARQLSKPAQSTKFPLLRTWILQTIDRLQRMESDAKRQDEEERLGF